MQELSPTILCRAWLKHYAKAPESGTILQSWDCATKISATSDYSVGVTVLAEDDKYYVLDVVRQRAEYPLLKQLVRKAAERFRPDAILLEDKGAGQALLQELRDDKLSLKPIIPKQDRITRALRASAVFERGAVLLPESAPWLDAYIGELTAFPHGKHEDQFCATEQGILWAEEKQRGGRAKYRGGE
jgi:predicted phage terminase large subunit-like protein